MRTSCVKILTALIWLLGAASWAQAQDLGPIGPKAGGGSKPSGPNTAFPVNLPYKPQSDEEKKAPAKKHSPQGDNAETDTVASPPKAPVIPDLPSKYPSPIGAPDMGI